MNTSNNKRILKTFLVIETFLIICGVSYEYSTKEVSNFTNLIGMMTSGLTIPFYLTLRELLTNKFIKLRK